MVKNVCIYKKPRILRMFLIRNRNKLTNKNSNSCGQCSAAKCEAKCHTYKSRHIYETKSDFYHVFHIRLYVHLYVMP